MAHTKISVLTENCFRGYLVFTKELSSIMDYWNIGGTGTTAVRHGFCVTRVITTYSPIWMSTMVGTMLTKPSLALVTSIPAVTTRVDTLTSKVRTVFGLTLFSEEDMIENHVQDALFWIVGFLNTMSIAITFGVWSPLLLLFAAAVGPFCLFFNSLIVRFSHQLGSDQMLHYKLAFELMTQVPTKHFGAWTITCLMISTLCALYDYGFGCGSWILFGVCLLGYIATKKMCAHRQSLLACSKDEIVFMAAPHHVIFNDKQMSEANGRGQSTIIHFDHYDHRGHCVE